MSKVQSNFNSFKLSIVDEWTHLEPEEQIIKKTFLTRRFNQGLIERFL